MMQLPLSTMLMLRKDCRRCMCCSTFTGLTPSIRISWFLDHVGSQPAAVGPAWTLDLHHLAPGPHTILVYAVDGEQNYGVAEYPITVPV